MLPQHLIDAFWDQVRGELRDRHGLTPPEAALATAGYRAEVDHRGGGELVYHRGPTDVAVAVVGWRLADADPAADVPA